MREVRCPTCGRCLAVEHDNGLIEVKTSRQVVWTERALLSCSKCGCEVSAPQHPEKIFEDFVDKGESGG